MRAVLHWPRVGRAVSGSLLGPPKGCLAARCPPCCCIISGSMGFSSLCVHPNPPFSVQQAGIEPDSEEELSVQEAYTPESTCWGCGEPWTEHVCLLDNKIAASDSRSTPISPRHISPHHMSAHMRRPAAADGLMLRSPLLLSLRILLLVSSVLITRLLTLAAQAQLPPTASCCARPCCFLS